MQQHVGPPHSVCRCPICEGGLCGIRICTGDDPLLKIPKVGFVLCDECEAVWSDPDAMSEHDYVDPENPRCPVFGGHLWSTTRWANRDDVASLGWSNAIDPDLDIIPDQV